MNWRDLTISFRRPNHVQRITVKDGQICRGDIVLVTGPSGTGKSTFLKTLCGLVRLAVRPRFAWPFPFTSAIVYTGTLAVAPSEALHSRTSYMPQDPPFFDGLSILDNVRLLARPGRDDAALPQRLQDVLSLLGLRQTLDVPIEQLSGGERQRVALSRCLLDAECGLFCLDEPFSQTDGQNRRRAIELIYDDSIRNQRSYVIISHDVDELLPYASALITFSADGPGTTAAGERWRRDPVSTALVPPEVQELIPDEMAITAVVRRGQEDPVHVRLSRSDFVLSAPESAASGQVEARVLGHLGDKNSTLVLFVPHQILLAAGRRIQVEPGLVMLPNAAAQPRGTSVALKDRRERL